MVGKTQYNLLYVWLSVKKMEKEDYIQKWLEGTLNTEEKALFERTEAYKSLEELSNSLMSFKGPYLIRMQSMKD